MTNNPKSQNTQAPSWRDVLPIYPAAEIDPLMPEAALRALGDDIKKNGLQSPITIYDDKLLDGRNRLNAMEMAGITLTVPWEGEDGEDIWVIELEGANVTRGGPIAIYYHFGQIDPWAYVASANHHRRHLTPKEKNDRIAALLKATPEKSDRQIAEEAKSNRNKVGRIRKGLEQAGTCHPSDTRTDTKGRKQRAHRPPPRQTDLEDFTSDADVAALEATRAWLRNEAPDLADLVDQGRVSLETARATLRKRRDDAQKCEASQRDTLLRIPASAYSHLVALANKEFMASLHARLADPLFCAHLKQMMRIGFGSKWSDDPASDILTGAYALISLIQKLSAPTPPAPAAPQQPADDGLDVPDFLDRRERPAP
jgi:hypothetical protein